MVSTYWHQSARWVGKVSILGLVFATVFIVVSGGREARAEGVLIAGGESDTSLTTDILSSAEVYSPGSGKFKMLKRSMTKTRESHTATRLKGDVRILIAGGFTGEDDTAATASAEIFNGSRFVATPGSMSNPRGGHTATLLKSGKVLLCGGSDAELATVFDTCDLFNPKTGLFTATANTMNDFRTDFTATLLASGKVLLAGGENDTTVVDTADVYDPVAGTFTATSNSMSNPRGGHTATLLPNGKVLVAGGYDDSGNVNDSADLYDPATNSFTPTAQTMVEFRADHVAVLLKKSNMVLLCGGENNDPGSSSTFNNGCERYNSVADTFTDTKGPMQDHRASPIAVLLSNGRVLIAGGNEEGGNNSSAELYNPKTDTFLPTGGMSINRVDFTGTRN